MCVCVSVCDVLMFVCVCVWCPNVCVFLFRRSYVGVELVQWLLEQCVFVQCRIMGARIWQVLLELGILHSGKGPLPPTPTPIHHLFITHYRGLPAQLCWTVKGGSFTKICCRCKIMTCIQWPTLNKNGPWNRSGPILLRVLARAGPDLFLQWAADWDVFLIGWSEAVM